jgi:acetyl-CoA carboxylase biotin carboxyl carrier protein
MNAEELKSLIQFVVEQDISEFEVELGDTKLRLKRSGAARNEPGARTPDSGAGAASGVPSAASSPGLPPSAAGAGPGAHEPAAEEGLHLVRSPIVGTFYESPSPGAPAFVKPGDEVQSGQVLCIIEAMKLMNEIESEVSGTIVKRYVENAQPVEYGQPLFAIR